MAEWWLGPTTPDQCGQNPGICKVKRNAYMYIYLVGISICAYDHLYMQGLIDPKWEEGM